MPTAFSKEQQLHIHEALQKVAKMWIVDVSFQKIKIEDLTKEVGISKGAFYKFYETKELFFYEILRNLHKEIFSSELELLTSAIFQSPVDALVETLLHCCNSIEESQYKRFFLEDSHAIMKTISVEEMMLQTQTEIELFRKYINHYGELVVEEELAFDAIRAIVSTAFNRKKLGTNYETILRWMAQGVCNHIFK